METSAMALNHGAAASHESDAGSRWRGLVLATLLPLVLSAQTRPIETDGGRGLAIMWAPLFVRNMQQPTENRCTRSGGLSRENANEVERVGMALPHRIGRQIKGQIK